MKRYKKIQRMRERENPELDPAVWILNAWVEEADGNIAEVEDLIKRGVETLQRNGIVIERGNGIAMAELMEKCGYFATCQAIINKTIGIGLDEEDRARIWMADAEDCKKRGSIETARAIYNRARALARDSTTNKSIWLKAAQLEKSHGSLESARFVLLDGYSVFPNCEEIWLAAFNLEFENNELETARRLLARARERGGTERIWMKSAIVERELGNVEEERRFLDEGLKKFPLFFKLWLMLGQLEERFSHLEQAKKAYESGLKNCPNCIPLWLSLANLEEKVTSLNKARDILTMARKQNPETAELWLAAIRTEQRHKNKREAWLLMQEALRECPNSGILVAADIEMTSFSHRETKCRDAVKKCNHDPHVTAVVAKFYLKHDMVETARKWFKWAVMFDSSIGDHWALYYKFELDHGSEENQKEVLADCVASEPKYGEKWQAISKAVENSYQPIEVILKKVVIALSKEKLKFFSRS